MRSKQVATKILDVDEGFRLARNIEARVSSKETIGPKRALSAARGPYHNETRLKNNAVRGLIEIYRHITQEKLHKMMMQNSEAAKFSYEISSSLKEMESEKEITIGIVDYRTEGRLPNRKEIEFLLDLINNPHFDIVATPIMRKLTCEEYIDFLKAFVDIYESSSFLPALSPCIPHYSSMDLANLFEYYAKTDQFEKSFLCVDFNGSNPISQYMFVSVIAREATLLYKELGDPVFLHALNLKYGKATKKQIVVPAKDLLVFTMGFNSFGANHKRLPIASGIGTYELKTKLLNRTDYGYYSLNKAGGIVEDPEAHEISLGDVLSDEKMAKFYNAEKQGLEATKISQIIKEHKFKPYIESKEHVKSEQILKIVGKVHGKAMQTKL